MTATPLAQTNAVPPGYKQTEVGVIPEDWEVRPLAVVSEIRTGVAKNESVAVRDPVVVCYLRVANVQDGFLDLSEVSSIRLNRFHVPRYAVQPGDVLMNEGGDLDKLGRGAVWQGQVAPCVHQNHVFVVRCGQTLRPAYLNVWTASTPARRYFMVAGKQTTNLASINKTALGQLPVALPSRTEQEAIAGALSDADGWIESLEKLIAKKRAIKQGTMQALLTPPGHPGHQRLPGFDGGWEVKRLGEVALFLSGGTPSRSNEDYWHGDIPWISASTLRCFKVHRSHSNVTQDAVAAGSKMAPIGSTLLLVRGSALHNEILSGLVIEPVCFNQDVKALVPCSSLFPMFLTFVTRGRSADLLELVSSAGNTAGVLDTKLLKAFEVHLPSVPEQTAIATVLSDIDTEIEALRTKLAKAQQVKQGMMQELLTGRIRLVKAKGGR